MQVSLCRLSAGVARASLVTTPIFYVNSAPHLGHLYSCLLASAVQCSIGSITGCTITEKAPTRAFSWLKAPTSAFTFKTLLRHYG